jgi:hypothetical protein
MDQVQRDYDFVCSAAMAFIPKAELEKRGYGDYTDLFKE